MLEEAPCQLSRRWQGYYHYGNDTNESPRNTRTEYQKMVKRDGRTIEQITHLMKWSGQHAFWRTVILSPVSFRRNWDRLVSQVKQERASAKGQVLVMPKKQVEEFRLRVCGASHSFNRESSSKHVCSSDWHHSLFRGAVILAPAWQDTVHNQLELCGAQ